MSNTIRIKRRASGGTGAPASLQNAELAFNEVGNVLYYGKGTGGSGGSATTVEAIGGSGAFVDLTSTQSVGGAKTFSGAITFSSTVAVQAPTAGAHATTKDYVDSLVSSGVVWLDPVRLATTTNVALNGVPALIDGIAPSAGDRILVRAQTNAAQNGIYTASFSSWTRTADFDTVSSAEISSGKSVFVSEGTANGGTQWVLSTTGTITLGTTGLNWTQIGGNQNDTGKNVGDEGVSLFIQKVGKELELRKLTAESGSGIGVDTPGALNGSARITVSTIPVSKGGTGATDAGTARTNLGLAIGTNVQAYDADLAAIAALSGTSGFLKKTGADAWSLDTASYQASDATLTALAGVTTAANKLIYATGADAFTTTDLTSFGRQLIDDADATAARSTLGVAIGTNVQAWDADLDTIAGITGLNGLLRRNAGTWQLDTQTYLASDQTLVALAGVTTAADKLIYATGVDTFTTTDLTSFGRQLIDDGDATTARSTLGLQSMATQAANNVSITGGTIAGVTIDGGTF